MLCILNLGEKNYTRNLMEWTSLLLKFTDAQHGNAITIGEGPKPVDSCCLTNLHVDARRVGCGRDKAALPGKIHNLNI